MGRVTDLRESAAGSLIVGYGTLHECPRCGLAGLWLNKRGNLRRESFAHVVGDLAEPEKFAIIESCILDTGGTD